MTSESNLSQMYGKLLTCMSRSESENRQPMKCFPRSTKLFAAFLLTFKLFSPICDKICDGKEGIDGKYLQQYNYPSLFLFFLHVA